LRHKKDGFLIMASDNRDKSGGIVTGNKVQVSINLHSEEEINKVFAAMSGPQCDDAAAGYFPGRALRDVHGYSASAGCSITTDRRRKSLVGCKSFGRGGSRLRLLPCY
jgi:hypothetical protein